jgi:hypothetical protein
MVAVIRFIKGLGAFRRTTARRLSVISLLEYDDVSTKVGDNVPKGR